MSAEMTEEFNRFFDIDEDILSQRVSLIRAELRSTIDNLRKEIPEDEPDEQLFDNKSFVRWNIANLILQNSLQDKDNIAFNRLVYFLYQEVNDINKLIDMYKLEAKYELGRLIGFELIILEEE